MNYRIKYKVILSDSELLDKEIIVKNKDNELIAKVSLEDYLRKKYGDKFVQLFIDSCEKDLSNAFNLFDSLFGGGFRWK